MPPALPKMPLMRASFMQSNVAELGQLGNDAEARVRDAVGEEALEIVSNAARTAWLPLQHNVDLVRHVTAVVGERRRDDWFRSSMHRSLRTPLLEPLRKAAFRVFGVSPGALFRAMPSGWNAVYRNVGSVKHRAMPNAASVTLSALPALLFEAPGYIEGLCGTFGALLDVAETAGTVELISLSKRRRSAAFEIRWGRALAV